MLHKVHANGSLKRVQKSCAGTQKTRRAFADAIVCVRPSESALRLLPTRHAATPIATLSHWHFRTNYQTQPYHMCASFVKLVSRFGFTLAELHALHATLLCTLAS